MRETRAQRDAKVIALRGQIMEIVRQHQPVTCYEIAQHLSIDTGKISSCCHGLGRNAFLRQGEPVISVYKNKRKTDNYVCTWIVGDDSKRCVRLSVMRPLRRSQSQLPMKILSG